MKSKISFANVIKFAGAFVACAIGSGFATGQEIMQFFSAHGLISIIGTLITTVIFAWCGGMFMKHGYELQLDTPGAIVQYYFGEKTGRIFEILFQVFLYGVYIIMIAGAGATLSEYFGLNPVVGRVGMALLALFTVILGLTKLTDILGSLGAVIIVLAVGVGFYGFLSNADGLKAAADIIPTLDMTKTPGGWLWASILYPGFNAIVVIILAGSIGKSANSGKEALLSGVLGGTLFGLCILFMNLGLLSNIQEVFDKAVPTLVLAERIGHILGLIFSVIICCGIYTTTVPMLWGVCRQFAEDKTKKFIVVAVILSAVGLVLGMTDFKVLVNVIYPFSGYMGLVLFIFMLYREFSKKEKRKEAGARLNAKSRSLNLKKFKK